MTLNNLWARAEPLFKQAERLARNDGGGGACDGVHESGTSGIFFGAGKCDR